VRQVLRRTSAATASTARTTTTTTATAPADFASEEFVLPGSEMPDLAPMIYRQRLVVEGHCAEPISAEMIRDYLYDLSDACGMRILLDPVTHRSDLYGWAGWVHWEASGVHVYAWEQPILFFSVDIYTCRRFDPAVAIAVTRERFGATRIVAKEF
jgi:S-adenosylmethionine/arginine decarboxylase-like enzyme